MATSASSTSLHCCGFFLQGNIILHPRSLLVGSGRRCLLPFLAHLKHYLCLSARERIQPLQSNRNCVNAFSKRVGALMGSRALQLLQDADHFGETENAHEPPATLIPTGAAPNENHTLRNKRLVLPLLGCRRDNVCFY